MSFTNPIIGGGNALIREAIKSPNYVAGLSGWSINKDGTAEFNGVTVRGELLVTDPDGSYVRIYDQDPGSGALIELGLPTASGAVLTPASITSSDDASGTGEPGIVIKSATVNGSPFAILNFISDVTQDISRILGGATEMNLEGETFMRLYGGSTFLLQTNPTGGTITIDGTNTILQVDGTQNNDGSLTVAGDVTVGGTITGARPWCRVFKVTTAQTLTNNTVTPVTFNGETADDRGWHSTVTNPSRITPDLPGRYLVVGNVTFAANATGDRRGYILKNGTTNGNWSRDFPSGAVQTQTDVMGIVDVNGTTDYIEIAALQSSGGNLDIAAGGDATFSCVADILYMGSVP